MIRNRYFRGTTLASSLFRYEKFNLQRVELQHVNGSPFAGTPIDTTNSSKPYYNVITALGFERSGNLITLTENEGNHFFLVFDLTFTREAIKSFTLFPELTGDGLTLKLTFVAYLTEAVEFFLIGERFSHITIDASRNILKNSLATNYWIMKLCCTSHKIVVPQFPMNALASFLQTIFSQTKN